MYQPDDGSSYLKKIVGVIFVLIVGSVFAVIAREGTQGLFNYFNSSPSAIDEQIQKSTEENPQLGLLYKELKAEFPGDYQRLLEEGSEAARAGHTPEQMHEMGRNFMREFVVSQASNIAKSPPEVLAAALDAQIQVIELLADESPYMCGQFATTGLRSQPSGPALAAMGSAGALLIKAAAAGRDRPVDRIEATEGDWQILVEQMLSHGVPASDIDHMANQTTDSMTPNAQCDLGLALYRSVREVDPDASARLSATILAPPT